MTMVALNIQSEADVSAIRTEVFNGTEFTVVPVIALVEGVLHSANAADPELALADEFGKFPESWNGRPLVMNHPKVAGSYVSANSPAVLQDWSFGSIFNTRLEGIKLKTEAWIDNARVAELGGEVEQTLNRILSGDTVEVSTGLFTNIIQMHGVHNNEKYEGIWSGVAPDHLAFLSEGTIGACSVADGCGVPRLNMLRTNAQIRAAKKHNESNGGQQMPNSSLTQPQLQPQSNIITLTGEQMLQLQPKTTIESIIANAKTVVNYQAKLDEHPSPLVPDINVNSFPVDMAIEDVEKLVKRSLNERLNGDLYAVEVLTQDNVVYETWASMKLFQRSIEVKSSSEVILGDIVTEVNILKKVVPVVGDSSSNSNVSTNSSSDNPEVEKSSVEGLPETPDNKEVSTMSEETTTIKPDEPSSEIVSDVQAQAQAQTPVPAPEPKPVLNKVQTTEEYISSAPVEMREVLTNGLKMHNAHKSSLVAGLIANDRNEFSENSLKAMNIEDLERMSKLANVPDYSGRGASVQTNAANDDDSIPAPMEAFPLNSAKPDAA